MARRAAVLVVRTVSYLALVISGVTLLEGQCQPSFFPQYGGAPPTSGLNFVTLDLDLESFPDSEVSPRTGEIVAVNLQQEIMDGVSEGAKAWNDSCNGQPSNRYPTLIPQSGISLPQSRNVPIFYGSRLDPFPHPCTSDPSSPLCYAFAELRQSLNEGTAELEVFRAGGKENQLALTFETWDGRFRDLFAHEFAHIFGLDESPCPGSVVHQDTSVTGGGQVTEGDCAVLQGAHQPRNPLQALIGGTEAACFLEGYCSGSPPTPWGTLRTSCGWVLRTQTESVSFSVLDPLLGLFEYFETVERVVPEYTCLSWYPFQPPPEGGPPLPPPIELDLLAGPTISLALPRENQVVSGSFYLRGWVGSWLFGIGDVGLWIDGQLVQPADLSWGLYSPELCDAGLDPGACDPYSGLSASIDVSHLEMGEHWLEVAVVDTRSGDPLANYLGRRFVVAEAPNSDPVAVDDQGWAVIELPARLGLPVDIEVTRNDYDPEGDPIRLTNLGIVQPPRYGTAQRISDHVIRYTPSFEALPDPLVGPLTDSFRYAIRDPDNLQDRGEVELSIFFAFNLP